MFQINDIISQYRSEGRRSLDEAESKKLLGSYGVPVVAESVVTGPDEAAAVFKKLGLPVVLKGLGPNLTHKTEKGVVQVNLQTSEQVRQAFEEIKAAGGSDWEGCLVQPMVEGRREFMAGLIRDPQFGPVVMFGLGGIFAEALNDVVFRIAPMDEKGALQMLSELASGGLLDNFRGEKAADREQLVRVLAGLSRLGVEHPEIKEVDINPLIVSSDGQVTAVDALVILEEPNGAGRKTELDRNRVQERELEINAALEQMAYPESIAVVGAARAPAGGFVGIFACIRDFGFPGRLYPVNPKAEDIDGIKAYPGLSALPEKVDLVVISLPAPLVPDALRECAATGNRNIHIFSSGFKETGEPEGIALQEEIGQIAREGGLHVIGPNCMGIHVPESRLLTWRAAADKSGPVAFISQSGGHAQDFTCYASSRLSLYFSKVISYGNALTLDSTDFLAYLAVDEKTRIIAMYLEGVADGRRLFDLVTTINRKKPVIILKGGLTESGARTVASHTGSLAGGEKIWKAFFRQSGAVQANSLEEMAEVALAFNCLGPVRGRGVGILGTGGGIGVAAADSCAQVGLDLPSLSPELLQRIREYIPPAGNMIRNPIDAYILFFKLELLGPVLELLAEEPDLDMFIISLHLDWFHGIDNGGHLERIAEYIALEAPKYTKGKPLVVVWRQYQPAPEIKATRIRLENRLLEAGVPVYEGLDRALAVLAKLADYHAFQDSRDK